VIHCHVEKRKQNEKLSLHIYNFFGNAATFSPAEQEKNKKKIFRSISEKLPFLLI
jgi:hypothetical protein